MQLQLLTSRLSFFAENCHNIFMPHITVVKKSGERVPFSEEKIIHSMERVGVPFDLQPQVIKHILSRVQKDNSITTDEIFYHIREFLKEKDKKSALRFNLRQAVFDLGPTGFPFEKYIERIFKTDGYKTQVDVIMQGQCVSHEVDLVVEKEGIKEIVEVKFHNQNMGKTDVQVMLYTYARFLDIKEKNDIKGVWVVTNTKLTSDAINYANCKEMRAVAWNYPESGNLQNFVEDPKMYPVTILNSFTSAEKQSLLSNDIVLASDLLNVSDEVLENKFLIDKERISEAKDSAKIILRSS